MSRGDDISRRDMLRGRLSRSRDAAADAAHSSTPPGYVRDLPVMRYPRTRSEAAPEARRTIPVLRPPGAVEEASFLAGCTRCSECIKACPHDAIVPAPARLRGASGTPMIAPDRQPCHMCDDFPCISACEPNVLSTLVPVMMGTARVVEHLCLAYHGTMCTVCSEQCPVDGAIDVVNGRPVVREEVCTGCGTCRHVCPAPENAILSMPTFQRPARPVAPGE